MNEALDRWNRLPEEAAVQELLSCSGSRSWARAMASKRPFRGTADVLAASDEACRALRRSDWLEAFACHPRIGAAKPDTPVASRAEAWSRQEQREAVPAGDAVKLALAEGNLAYEEKFGHIFIVCATGKSAGEILEILRRRLQNEREAEFSEAAEQQRQITQLRLRKWLGT